MSQQKWGNDADLQNEVHKALSGISPKAYGGFDGIKKAIRGCPDGDWDNLGVRVENIRDIVQDARARAKRKGLMPSSEKEQIQKLYTFTGFWRTYATLEKMREAVEVVRLRYWETSSPPFAKTNEGRIKAEAWFSEQEGRDLDSATHVPVTYEVKRLFRKEHDANVARGLVSDWQAAQMLKPGMTQLRLTQLCEQEAAMLSKFSKEQPPREIQAQIGRPERPLLNLPSNFLRREVAAIVGQTLGKLKGDVSRLRRESGWWSESEAISHVLFGTVGARGVSWNYDHTSRDLTLMISGPATEREVQGAYREVLERLGRKPLALSVQQEALLRLVADMPNATFAERFKAWQEKCEHYPEVLKPYTGHKALQASYYSARKRALEAWGESDNAPLPELDKFLSTTA